MSGAINATLNAGSYAINQLRKGEDIDSGELIVNAGIGFASGVAGNLFRNGSTSALRETGENLIEKGSRKLANGIANSSPSTVKRAFYYWDQGVEIINQYAVRAGVNSGFGSVVGICASVCVY